MLSIAQEALSEEIFTDTRWNRRREDLLALLLSLDDHIDWTADSLAVELISQIKSCAFVPDEDALIDLFLWHLEVLSDQGTDDLFVVGLDTDAVIHVMASWQGESPPHTSHSASADN